MSKAGERVLKSAQRARAFARGDEADGFVVHVPEQVNVRAIRGRLKMTREEFAARFGFKAAAVKDWEQGRRHPERSARILLRVIEREPDAVKRALSAA